MTMSRRDFVAAVGVVGVGATAVSALGKGIDASAQPQAKELAKGRLKQSVCRWCFGGMKLEDLCKAASAIGIRSVELLNPDEWPVAKGLGLECAVASFVKSNPISKGFNRVEHHDAIIKELEERLPLVKEAGIPNQIVFSGNRAGMSDAEGLKNCAAGLKRIMPLADKLGVTVIMELLNSKVDHKDYMCDRTPWGVELVKQVGSPRFKLLYDIYHMQIMEGDVIRTITDHFDSIGHFHTAGVPGRHEIDGSQELNYKAICEAIVSKGYTGYLGQEFMPAHADGMESLKEAFKICDV
jgi:hydroxypyruvate isomerase